MSQSQTKAKKEELRDYTVTAVGPVNIAGALKRKDDLIRLLPSVAADYSHCLKAVKAPRKPKG